MPGRGSLIDWRKVDAGEEDFCCAQPDGPRIRETTVLVVNIEQIRLYWD